MSELAGSEPSDPGAWESAAKMLVRDGRAKIVALTMGHLGAALLTEDTILRAQPLAIEPRSVVGAGDSFLGALVYNLASGTRIEDSFRQVVAAGAAALLNPGTELCRPDDIKRLSGKAFIEAT